jgi:predicted branched-subunit amino acid permease
MLPAAIGIAPFGVAIGAAIASADLDPVPALASSLLLFAGSAQLAMVQQLDARVAPVLVVLTVVVINARFVAYSAALAPLFPTTVVTTRAVMAATLVDQTYLVTTIEAAGGRRSERDLARFYLGASLAIGAVWLGSQAAGVLAGAALPAAANLGAAAPLSLAGLASRVTKDRSSGAAMAAGAVGMVVLAPVAGPAALLVAVALGVLASAATRRRPPSGEVAP